MKYWRLIAFIVVAGVQLAVPASLVWKREHTLRRGSTWKFRTAPVDPVDAFRGRYVALRFEAETHEIAAAPTVEYGDPVFVILRTDGEGFAEIDQVTTTRPSGDDYIGARLNGKR